MNKFETKTGYKVLYTKTGTITCATSVILVIKV